MSPAALFRAEHYPISRRPLNRIIAKDRGERIESSLTRAPYLLSAVGRYINYSNGPGHYAFGIRGIGIGHVKEPNECDSCSVRGPTRRDIAIDAALEKPDRRRFEFIYTDEAVIAAGRNKSQFLAVGRPDRFAHLASRFEGLCRLARSACDPKMI